MYILTISWYHQNSDAWLDPELWTWNAGFSVLKPAHAQHSRFPWCSTRCHHLLSGGTGVRTDQGIQSCCKHPRPPPRHCIPQATFLVVSCRMLPDLLSSYPSISVETFIVQGWCLVFASILLSCFKVSDCLPNSSQMDCAFQLYRGNIGICHLGCIAVWRCYHLLRVHPSMTSVPCTLVIGCCHFLGCLPSVRLVAFWFLTIMGLADSTRYSNPTCFALPLKLLIFASMFPPIAV